MNRSMASAGRTLILSILTVCGPCEAQADRAAKELGQYARDHDWVNVLGERQGEKSCTSLLKSIRSGALGSAAPRVVADDSYAASLVELARCETYRVPERSKAPVPNNFIWSARDLGDHSFRIYRIVTHRSGGGTQPLDVIYAEYKEKRLLTNAYHDAFTIIDLERCESLDSVTTQRPRKKDESTGAARNFIRGLFLVNDRAFLITNSEQVGHLSDPDSYRAMDAWALQPEGKFLHSCQWIPRTDADSKLEPMK